MSSGRPHPNPAPGEQRAALFRSSRGDDRPGAPEGEGLYSAANAARGEAAIRVAGERLVLRPTFAALVAAEGELGPLFALVERAAEGRLALGEMVALFWHCLRERPEGLTREALGEAVAAGGLTGAAPVLRVLLGQILVGR